MHRYTGQRLLVYLRDEASLASPYQPLLIAALIRAGGRAPADGLAALLLTSDRTHMRRARAALMRWPLRTFRTHGIADYYRPTGDFVLPVDIADDDQRSEILDLCDGLAAGWDRQQAGRLGPSRRYAMIEAAGGRCQACGAAGSDTALDIDHVVPRAAAKTGKVVLPAGETVGVDDPANLQVLCATCNRGKRDLGSYDFRPTLDRLAETMETAAAHALRLGHAAAELDAARGSARERLALGKSPSAMMNRL